LLRTLYLRPEKVPYLLTFCNIGHEDCEPALVGVDTLLSPSVKRRIVKFETGRGLLLEGTMELDK
jgi:hypothetical protein